MTTAERTEQRVESYEEWLTRVVDAMPPFTEQQQRELRELLHP